MTKPRTYACSFVFFIILSLHTKADRLQNQNHMSVVLITYSSEREGDHCCVKEYIEMPTRFHSRFVPHKSMWLKRLLTLKEKGNVRVDEMH